MDIRYLPYESPAVWREIENTVVEACIQALTKIVGPLLAEQHACGTPAEDRYAPLAERLADLDTGFASEALKALAPRRTRWSEQELADDPGTTHWDVAAHLLVSVHQVFPEKDANPLELPHYLHRLAQQLKGIGEPTPARLAKVCRNLFDELTADLSAEALNTYYGIPATANLVLKVLRPVDKANNDCLRFLRQWRSRPELAARLVGRPLYPQQATDDAAIRRALTHKRVPARWLMRWNEHHAEASQALAALGEAAGPEPARAPLDGKDLQLATPAATEAKLERTLAQLALLEELGTHRGRHVSLDDWLERLADDTQDRTQDFDATDLAQPGPEAAAEARRAAQAGRPLAVRLMDEVLDELPMAVGIGVQVRLLAQVQDKDQHKSLKAALEADMRNCGTFDALGLAPPRWSSLKPAALAAHAGLSVDAFNTAVDAALARCAEAAARPTALSANSANGT